MSKKSLYLGHAGQMAVMSEFLARGYNVAVPEVDVGDDIFVVRDDSGEYYRIQVKTSIANKTRNGYSTRYTLKFKQLETFSVPETWYVFASRLDGDWLSFIVISRQELFELYTLHQIGSVTKTGSLSLYFSHTDEGVVCSNQDLTPYLNKWSYWPNIDP